MTGLWFLKLAMVLFHLTLAGLFVIWSVSWGDHKSSRRVILITYPLLRLLAAAAFVSEHLCASVLLSLCADVLLVMSSSSNNKKWKDRWGKIKSAALTLVNQASFRQQQKEAFS